MSRPAAARSSAIHVSNSLPCLTTTRTTSDLSSAATSCLAAAPPSASHTASGSLSVLLPPPNSRPKNSVKASGITRMKMNDSLSRTVSSRSLRARSAAELHANRLRMRSTAKKKKATAKPSGTSTCQRMSRAPPPRIVVSQPSMSQPLGVNFCTVP